MTNLSNAEGDVPVWARSSAFLLKPITSPYGFIDSKGGEHAAESSDDLAKQLSESRLSFDYLWTPDDERLVVPEQLELAHAALRKRQRVAAGLDVSNGLRMCVIFGFAFLWSAYSSWTRGGLESVYGSQFLGLSSLLLFIFGLLPLYNGWKLKRHLRRSVSSSLFDEVPEARFDAWIRFQRVPVTYLLIGGLSICLLAQLYIELGSFSFEKSVIKAGLLKDASLHGLAVSDATAWWRVFTAPMLHGNVIHFLMNAAGVLYLGRRTELLARWPHLLIVFLSGMWIGGMASTYWVPDKVAVGASGGMMGLLGFLLFFETLHSALVPRPARRRLFAGVVLIVVTGVLGVSFIDNAAHAGGFVAGAAYACVVFPPSSSFHRPVSMVRDRVAGSAVGVFLFGIIILTVIKVLT